MKLFSKALSLQGFAPNDTPDRPPRSLYDRFVHHDEVEEMDDVIPQMQYNECDIPTCVHG